MHNLVNVVLLRMYRHSTLLDGGGWRREEEEGDTIVSALHSSPPQLQSDRAQTNVRTRGERRPSCNVTTTSTNHRNNNIALNHFSEDSAMICVRGEG